ncbi:SdpI family protein [Devosia aquimaris]|uniref:SdpI family protein n=1 Tax=Devosia aquimaris TaxID=2866214 RepID=UPI001CD17F4E|nr:SdpI family protein [Devosia sp. CJK-A8-3]
MPPRIVVQAPYLASMQNLVTRFHMLLFSVTIAITAVALLRVPADFVYPAHWSGSTVDWSWSRNMALSVGPLLDLMLMALFFAVGRALTRNHYAKSQHILDPALSAVLALVAACQMGLLLTGVGSDVDLIRIIGFGFGAALMPLALVIFEAERHTYAGLRAPWPIASDRAWRWVHRLTGIGFGLGGIGVLVLAWLDSGPGPLVLAFAAALSLPVVVGGLATLALRGT